MKLVQRKEEEGHIDREQLRYDIFRFTPYGDTSPESLASLYFFHGRLVQLSKFLRCSLMIFIIKGFRTIVFIFIVISTMFRPICPLVFFRCLSNSGTFTELRTTSSRTQHNGYRHWFPELLVFLSSYFSCFYTS